MRASGRADLPGCVPKLRGHRSRRRPCSRAGDTCGSGGTAARALSRTPDGGSALPDPRAQSRKHAWGDGGRRGGPARRGTRPRGPAETRERSPAWVLVTSTSGSSSQSRPFCRSVLKGAFPPECLVGGHVPPAPRPPRCPPTPTAELPLREPGAALPSRPRSPALAAPRPEHLPPGADPRVLRGPHPE